MQEPNLRFRVLTKGSLIIALLLACSVCSNCRRKTPEPKPEQQPAESNVPDVAATVQSPPPAASSRIPLRILYVGLPNTQRQQDFVTFLGKHFTQVETADYNALREEQTGDCDVAIFDKDGLEWDALDINVSPRYSRATVTLGVPGAFWVRRVSRRMGYM